MEKKRKDIESTYLCIICSTQLIQEFIYREHTYYRCKNCLLVSTLPYPSTKNIVSHYQKKFKQGNYNLLKKYSQEYKNVYEEFARVLEKRLTHKNKKLKGLRVLDVGCFTGEFLEILQEKGADVYGLELQKDAVKIAQKKMPGKIFMSDVMNDPMPRIKFDVVSMLGLIEHVTNPIKLLEKVSLLLKDGGIILVQTPNSGSLLARIMRQYWPPYEPVEHIHLFSETSIRKALSKSGFIKIEKKRSIKRLPVTYALGMFENFGPEFYTFIRPLFHVARAVRLNVTLPLYVGEMIITAQKKKVI